MYIKLSSQLVLVLIFVFTISFTVVYADDVDDYCSEEGKTTNIKVISFQTKQPITLCHFGGVDSYIGLPDKENYKFKNGNYYYVEELSKPCENTANNCVTLLGYEDHLVELVKPVTKKQTSSSSSTISKPIVIVPEPVTPIPKSSDCRQVYSTVKYFGYTTACIIDEEKHLYGGSDNHIYKLELFDKKTEKFTDVTPFKFVCNDELETVMERSNCHYKEFVDYTIKTAQQKFNATKFKAALPPFQSILYKENNHYDCSGKQVSSRNLECAMSKAMKKEESKAMKNIFNGTKLIAKLPPPKTIINDKDDSRKLFLKQQKEMGNWLLK